MWNNELPSGNNYTIRLYLQHLGEFRTYATNEKETFDSLRQKIIKRASLILKTHEQYFFKVAFKYYSMLRRGKATYIPMGNELVVDVVRREETGFNGIISLCFLDIRRECNPFFIRPPEHDVGSASAIAAATAVASSSSLTEWVSREYHFTNSMDSKLLNNVSLPEALFWEVSDIALVQGKLQKRMINPINKKEVWKEQYYILDINGRLWTFVGSRFNSNAPIDKDSPLPFCISVNIDSIRAHIAPNMRDSGMFIVFYDDNINDDPVKLTFKAKNLDEARLWVSSFTALTNMAEAMQQQQREIGGNNKSCNNNSNVEMAAAAEERVSNIRGERDFETSLLSCSDNDFIFETELSISKYQAKKSEQETRNLVDASSKLDSLLANRYLRGHFKKFLISACLEENLLFWEYSMDYRVNYDRVVAVMQKSPAIASSLSPAHTQPSAPLKHQVSASSKSLASIHHSSSSSSSGSSSNSTTGSIGSSVTGATSAAAAAQEGSSLDDADDLNTLNGTLIKWAECILQVFMLHGAPYEVFSCAADDVHAITSALQQCKISRTAPSKDLFTHAQKASLRLIAEQQFSEFAKSTAARRVLLASIHAHERSNLGLNLLASVVRSDVEESAYDIKPKKIKPTMALSASIVTPEKDSSNSRFPLFRRMIDKAKTPVAPPSAAAAASPLSPASKAQHERQQSILNRDSAATTWRQQLLLTAAYTETMQKRLQEQVGIMDQLDKSAEAAAAVTSASANRPASKLSNNINHNNNRTSNSAANNRVSSKRGMVTADIAQGMNSSIKSQNHVAATSSRTFIRAMPSTVTPLKWLPDWWWADCIFDSPDVQVRDLFDCLEEDEDSFSLSNTQTTAAAMLGETDDSYDESTDESTGDDDDDDANFNVEGKRIEGRRGEGGGGGGGAAVIQSTATALNGSLVNRISGKHTSGVYFVSKVIKIPITPSPNNNKLATSSSSNGHASKHLSSRCVPLLQRPTWLAIDLNLPESEKPLTKLEPKDWIMPKHRRNENVGQLPQRKHSLTPLSLLGGSGSGAPVGFTAAAATTTKDEPQSQDINTGHLLLLWLAHHKDIAGKDKSLSVSEYFSPPTTPANKSSRVISALTSKHSSTASIQSNAGEGERKEKGEVSNTAAVNEVNEIKSSGSSSSSSNCSSPARASYRLSAQFQQDALRSSLPAFNREDKINSEMLQRFTSELRILKIECMSTQKMAQLRAYQPTAFINGTGQCAWQERGVGGAFNVYGGLGTVVLSSTMRCRYLFTHTRRRANVMSSSSSAIDPSLLGNAMDGDGGDDENRYSSASRLSGSRRTSVSGVVSRARKSESAAGTSSSVHDHHQQQQQQQQLSAGNRSLSEEFVIRSTNTTGTIWSRQHVVLTVHLGQPRLILLDTPSAAAAPVPFSNNQGTTLFSQAALSATIHLVHATQISPAPQWLHAIEIRDVSGAHWQLQPEGLDEDDTRQACKRWLDQLACYCLPSRTRIIHILKMGYLEKRGSFNTAFKSRWFVLTSDHKLRYYKDDGSAAGGDKSAALYKGEVDLLAVIKVECNSDPRTGSREIILTSNGSTGHSSGISRTWVLRADDAREADEWIALISELLAVRHIATSAAVVGGGTPHASMHLLSAIQQAEDGEGEDVDED